jgi:TMEM151 family
MCYSIVACFIIISTFLLQCCASPTNLGLQAASAVMGESAVVDKETGRIFWEGGSSNTLAESITPKLRSVIGISHTKATLLTALLILAAAGAISQILRDALRVFSVPDVPRPLLQRTTLSLTRMALLLPKFPRWFVLSLFILYLLEAYMCSTHKYLTYAVEDAESFVDQLRERFPIVEWNVRSFHYENYLMATLTKLIQRSPLSENVAPSFPSLWRWKCVTRTSRGLYTYASCKDRTVAGVWKRAPIRQHQSTQKISLTKVVVTKTLLLRDAKARQDYFRQQRLFLSKEHSDEYAEFSTNVHVDGFRPRILAVSDTAGVYRILLQPYMFWFFTCVGLTVPYRRWLSSRCDEIRVRVVKETSADPYQPSTGRMWFHSSPMSKVKESSSSFRSTIRDLNIIELDPLHPQDAIAIGRSEEPMVTSSAQESR